ncbi:MAG TPA: DUF84 family protein [Candidatus Paceibacterota bacterium]|nr:DUF84 family protein [Candidatus Paceibacterota bacterium]
MNIGFYTSKRYIEPKQQALAEALKRLNIEASIVHDESLERPSSTEQAFGFEELFKRAGGYAEQALTHPAVDVGVGVENCLTYVYSAAEWYYVICVALHMKDGQTAAGFTSSINVPEWMVKEVQDMHVKVDALTQRLAGEDDPVIYFSSKTLTRKDLMIPAFLLAFSKLNLPKG